MFKKILIANRGEIAVRIIKACREMDIISVAIFSEADKQSLHVRTADEAYLIGEAPSSESYLNFKKIITLAKKINADAIHPGYGFLSENDQFIESVEKEGIAFIGPDSNSVRQMGSKTVARKIIKNSGVPIVPGTTEPINSINELKKEADKIGYPVMLKASAGGGGKGMRRVYKEDELESSLNMAKSESKKAFNNDSVYLEKYIEKPRHIEIQILGDSYGNYIHIFERECSIQRRHQKIIEESPASGITEEMRNNLAKTAIKAAKSVNYKNAGTIEFLLDENSGEFYFLEMNTRLQVEHPVTELISGVDLVKEQIRIAAGEKLQLKQENLKIKGHAIECRIYAEDSENHFMPSTGKILHHRMPSGPGIRIDRGIDLLSEITIYYDPLLSKLVSYGSDREEAIERMQRALKEYQISGVVTNMPVLQEIIKNEKFISGNYDINFITSEFGTSAVKIDNTEEEIKIASILSAVLKHKDNRLKPGGFTCSPENKWKKK